MTGKANKFAVLITGASSGIGKATALHLDHLGFEVYATVRKSEDAQSLCAGASDRLIPLIMDVTDQASILRARDQVSHALGDRGLVGLVNNAGIGIGGALEFFPLDRMRRLYEVNLLGVLAVTQAFLPLLRRARGRIVNIGSSGSLFILPFHGPYSSAKLALNGLTNALRLEVQPHGVQVCLVICGSVNTPIWEKGSQESQQVANGYPPEAIELYGDRQRRMVEFFGRIGDAGLPPETAARQIARALTAKRPRNTYFVGQDAWLINIIDKLIYAKLRDWVVLRTIGLK